MSSDTFTRVLYVWMMNYTIITCGAAQPCVLAAQTCVLDSHQFVVLLSCCAADSEESVGVAAGSEGERRRRPPRRREENLMFDL